jgi:dihydropteroate synthase
LRLNPPNLADPPDLPNLMNPFPPRPQFIVPLPGGLALHLGERTLLMAVLNVTPDSFADGGRFLDPGRAVDAALAMQDAGADLIDVGGESTRPGAAEVSADEERRRIEPVLERLAGRVTIPISIDTYKAEVARAALDRGAGIVNDVSALRYDPALADVVAESGAAVILMHNRGRSSDMYRDASYVDAVAEIGRELGERLGAAIAAGISPERVVLDPGVGFAKRAEHSFEVLAGLESLAALGRPLLVGPSRKSYLQAAIGDREAGDRDWATAAAVTASVLLGAHIVRVHAVKEMADVVRTADAIRAAAETRST